MFTVLFDVAHVATPAAVAAAADAPVRFLVGLPGHLYKAE